MVRFVLSLLVGLLFVGSASAGLLDEIHAKAQANIKAQIEAGKIPPVNLSEAQITKLKTLFPKVDRMVWSRAGRQPDGKTWLRAARPVPPSDPRCPRCAPSPSSDGR